MNLNPKKKLGQNFLIDENVIKKIVDCAPVSNKNEILSKHKKNKFQPMPASFGLLPELKNRVKDKKLRYKAYQERSLKSLQEFKKIFDTSLEKDLSLVEIK